VLVLADPVQVTARSWCPLLVLLTASPTEDRNDQENS
jgi:hypothetical protein